MHIHLHSSLLLLISIETWGWPHSITSGRDTTRREVCAKWQSRAQHEKWQVGPCAIYISLTSVLERHIMKKALASPRPATALQMALKQTFSHSYACSYTHTNFCMPRFSSHSPHYISGNLQGKCLQFKEKHEDRGKAAEWYLPMVVVKPCRLCVHCNQTRFQTRFWGSPCDGCKQPEMPLIHPTELLSDRDMLFAIDLFILASVADAALLEVSIYKEMKFLVYLALQADQHSLLTKHF